MKKKWMVLAVSLVSVSQAWGFQYSLPNLRTASTLLPNQLAMDVDHRFGGSVSKDPLNTLFGLSEGASVGIGVRYGLNEAMRSDVFTTVRLHDTTSTTEWELGYSQDLLYVWESPVFLQGQISYFNAKNLNDEKRNGNLYYLLALQPKQPLAKKWLPVLNLGYDGYSSGSTVAAGLEYQFAKKWSVVGEVIAPNTDKKDVVWNVGMKLKTFGHNFIFSVQNSPDLGLRTLAKGTVEDDVYFGFKIQRLMDLDGAWASNNRK